MALKLRGTDTSPDVNAASLPLDMVPVLQGQRHAGSSLSLPAKCCFGTAFRVQQWHGKTTPSECWLTP